MTKVNSIFALYTTNFSQVGTITIIFLFRDGTHHQEEHTYVFPKAPYLYSLAAVKARLRGAF